MTPSDGIFGDVDTARDTATALQDWRLESKVWRDTAQAMKAEVESLSADSDKRLVALQEELDKERQAWRKRINLERHRVMIGIVLAAITGLVIGHNS